MGLGWATIQNSENERLASKVLVVWLDLTSKTSDRLILPAVTTNIQLVPHLAGSDDNKTFALNDRGIVLVSGEVCAKEFLLFTSMMVLAHVLGVNSASQDHKNLVNE